MQKKFWTLLNIFFLISSSAIAQDDVALVRSAVNTIGIEAYLKSMADEGNKSAPYMIDKETQYAAAVAIAKRLSTHWVFINHERSEIDVNTLKTMMTERGLIRLCSNPVSRMLINDYDATFNHSYTDKSGAFLFSFNVDRASCRDLK
jgi:hypothetical protein